MEAQGLRSSFYHEGTGGVLTITGADKEQVTAKANEVRDGIDMFRSPHVMDITKTDQGEWVARVKYYGLD